MFAHSVHQHANTSILICMNGQSKSIRATVLVECFDDTECDNICSLSMYPCGYAVVGLIYRYTSNTGGAEAFAMFAMCVCKSTMICGGKYLRITAYFECKSSAPYQG